MNHGTRRSFLLASAGVVLAGRIDPTAARPRAPLARGGSFPQGVLAGQTGPHGVTLWAQHAERARPGPLRLEVATDPGFANVVARRRVPVGPQTGIAWARVDRLAAARPYWYRFATADGTSPVGRFRTLPHPDSADPVRIGVFSCQMFFLGYFTGHAALAEEDLTWSSAWATTSTRPTWT